MKVRRLTMTACGTVLLIVAAVVVALRERMRAVPEVSVAQTSSEVRVKAVERNPAAAPAALAAPSAF